MLLGKRPRPPTTRTASTTGLPVDGIQVPCFPPPATEAAPNSCMEPLYYVFPRPPRRNHVGDYCSSHFLKACGLCKRRLGPGRDTFIYRGEMAFCSLECRQLQITMDEEKEAPGF